MTILENAGACDGSTHCITCSDAVELLRVDSTSDDGSLGVCVDANGNRSDVFLSLIPNAHAGEWVLVHAGVALLPSTAPTEVHA